MKNKFFKHLHLITKHRRMVFKYCCKCGLFWQGLVHDLSKYSPIEFFESVKYYTGTHSPITECKRQTGHSLAAIHHNNKNKHHFEYWHDPSVEIQINMPFKYAVECVCDKLAASKGYNPKDWTPDKLLSHWLKYGTLAKTNDNMKNFFTQVFTDLVEHGEKYILNKKYLKKMYDKIVLLKN